MPTIDRKTVRHGTAAHETPQTWRERTRRRIYNTERWRRLRAWQLATHPLCELCAREGRVRIAVDVHHIRPIGTAASESEAAALAYDPGNLMSLCKECHGRQHATGGVHT